VVSRAQWWEWWWGVSQQAAGTLLAAGIIYVATVVAGVLTFHLGLILAVAVLSAALAGFAFYAASKVQLEVEVAAELAEARRLIEEGRISKEEWDQFRRRK
jgi:hypothetical protein